MIIDGIKLAQELEAKLVLEADKLREYKIYPKCVTFVANEDPEGNFYTKIKARAAGRIGLQFESVKFSFSDKKDLKNLNDFIAKYSRDDNTQAMMIQKPAREIILKYFAGLERFRLFWQEKTDLIAPAKDVDCLTSVNLGKLLAGQPRFLPATAASIIKILTKVLPKNIFEGLNVTVIGSSEILGKPLVVLLRDKGVTVFWCGSKTKNLPYICKKSDIIISCTGCPRLITKDFVTKKSIVIDAGIRKMNEQIVGDTDFENIKDKVRAITPVPGGVGPLTVASLMENIILATKKLCGRE